MSRDLAEVQARIQEAILGNPDAAEGMVRKPAHGAPRARLDVYRAAYGLRLQEFIAHDYPKLACYLGDSRFGAMSRAYVASHPSDTSNARWYSRHLPEFQAVNAYYARTPELAELARLERALNDAFDAPDVAIVTIAELAAVDPADFGAMSMAISPSVHRFQVWTNVTSLWSSLRCGEAPPLPETLAEAQDVMVWRQGQASRFRLLGREEAMAVDAAIAGVPFAVVCEMIAVMEEPDTAAMRAATYLRGWIEAEIISALNCPADPAGSNPDRSA